MEEKNKERCLYEGRSYSNGSEVCSSSECKLCDDGKWQDVDEERSWKLRPSLAYFYH